MLSRFCLAHSPKESPAVAEQRSTTSGFSKRSFSTCFKSHVLLVKKIKVQ